MEHPGNNDQHIQNQRVLVTEAQATAQRPPACNLGKLCTEKGGQLIIISSSAQRKQTRGRDVRTHLPPLAGRFSAMEAGSQEEDQTDKEVVEAEDFCHHRPLPAQPGHGKQPPS